VREGAQQGASRRITTPLPDARASALSLLVDPLPVIEVFVFVLYFKSQISNLKCERRQPANAKNYRHKAPARRADFQAKINIEYKQENFVAGVVWSKKRAYCATTFENALQRDCETRFNGVCCPSTAFVLPKTMLG